MLDCAIVRDLLPQYKKNTLHTETRAAVEEHALTCPVCAGLLEAQSQQDAAFCHSLSATTPPQVGSDFCDSFGHCFCCATPASQQIPPAQVS